MHAVHVANNFSISAITPEDKPSLVKYLNDKDIYLRTLNIPFPYTPADAEAWLAIVDDWTRDNAGTPTSLCIRSPQGELVGGIGFNGLIIGKTHRAELGYWLAKPYWGQGIMTAAVDPVCKVAFSDFHLEKITAHIFSTNLGDVLNYTNSCFNATHRHLAL